MASGDTLATLFPAGAELPATAFAQLAVRADHAILAFDAAADEEAKFPFILPSHYDGGNLVVTVVWAAATATSGVCVWRAAVQRHEDGGHDIDSDAYQTAATVDSTAPGTAGEPQDDDITLSAVDSAAAGNMMQLRLQRYAGTDADDTMAGDAHLLSIHITEA